MLESADQSPNEISSAEIPPARPPYVRRQNFSRKRNFPNSIRTACPPPLSKGSAGFSGGRLLLPPGKKAESTFNRRPNWRVGDREKSRIWKERRERVEYLAVMKQRRSADISGRWRTRRRLWLEDATGKDTIGRKEKRNWQSCFDGEVWNKSRKN